MTMLWAMKVIHDRVADAANSFFARHRLQAHEVPVSEVPAECIPSNLGRVPVYAAVLRGSARMLWDDPDYDWREIAPLTRSMDRVRPRLLRLGTRFDNEVAAPNRLLHVETCANYLVLAHESASSPRRNPYGRRHGAAGGMFLGQLEQWLYSKGYRNFTLEPVNARGTTMLATLTIDETDPLAEIVEYEEEPFWSEFVQMLYRLDLQPAPGVDGVVDLFPLDEEGDWTIWSSDREAGPCEDCGDAHQCRKRMRGRRP